MKLSVVCSAFDEPALDDSNRLGLFVEHLCHVLGETDYEILVVGPVYGESARSVAKARMPAHPKVRVLRASHDQGFEAALIEAFSAAKGEALACIYPDLRHDPSILPAMLQDLHNGADVVVGSRLPATDEAGRWNWLRQIERVIAGTMVRFLLGIKLDDPMSRYFLVWRKDLALVQAELEGEGANVLLQLLAKIRPSGVREIPYRGQPGVEGEPRKSDRLVRRYMRPLWPFSNLRRVLFDRVLKYAFVGGMGILVDVLTMALLLDGAHMKDWRASAIANCVANLHNYLLNNFWTFADCTHKGFRVVKGYFSYFLMSLLGLGITTGLYAGLVWGIARIPLLHAPGGALGSSTRLICQFVAILPGVAFNFHLNRLITWPNSLRSNVPAAETSRATSDLN